MNLVEDQPKAFFMSYLVPPIKEKCANKPPNKAFSEWQVPGR